MKDTFILLFVAIIGIHSCKAQDLPVLGSDGYINLEGKGTAVGDGFSMTSVSCPHLQVDDVTGICYSTWMTHPTEYGEHHGYLSLFMFPGSQPFKCETYPIAAIGDSDENNKQIDGIPYESNCLIYYKDKERRQPVVRCFFTTEGISLYYRDFDPVTRSFMSKAKRVAVLIENNELIPVTGPVIKEWANQHRGNWSITNRLLFTDYLQTNNNIWNDGSFIYSVITGEDANCTPVIVKSDDYFATLRLVAVNPMPTRYECQMSKLGDTFYFLYRINYKGEKGIKFNTSRDLKNYSTSFSISNSLDERAQILNYNGNIYLVIPTNDCPNPVKGLRRAYHIYKGIGDSVLEYKDILWFVNRFGLVYLSTNIINGRLFMCYSTNMMMLGDNVNSSSNEGKSTGMFYLLDNFYEE